MQDIEVTHILSPKGVSFQVNTDFLLHLNAHISESLCFIRLVLVSGIITVVLEPFITVEKLPTSKSLKQTDWRLDLFIYLRSVNFYSY